MKVLRTCELGIRTFSATFPVCQVDVAAAGRGGERARAFQAVVLEARGFLNGRRATAHPAFAAQLSDQRYDCQTACAGMPAWRVPQQ